MPLIEAWTESIDESEMTDLFKWMCEKIFMTQYNVMKGNIGVPGDAPITPFHIFKLAKENKNIVVSIKVSYEGDINRTTYERKLEVEEGVPELYEGLRKDDIYRILGNQRDEITNPDFKDLVEGPPPVPESLIKQKEPEINPGSLPDPDFI
jgi:hypothetical protein